ncbi:MULTISPECIES: chorismate mutase [Mycobacterium]|nr:MULTISPECIES: chorismate mutase [Mycobacterium]MBI2700156.1 chorismate mutase [Mycobacterium sp.]MBX9981477.1 chorismate mutase [Mycobacterium gordonae]MCQ4365663.1 chorismate mutase [Mycobacterium gordonae]MCV7007988.1 chorismate mutase [Mycobacterium gordonae]PJE07911.1 MAG: chorismate mutase [Mycobacterium sp.]
MRPEPPPHENAEIAMNTETIGAEQLSIDELREEIDRLDAEILAAVKRRAEVSQAIGKVRMASGGTRLVHSREMKVIERYSELGPEGKDLAMLLLRLGRGRLGH